MRVVIDPLRFRLRATTVGLLCWLGATLAGAAPAVHHGSGSATGGNLRRLLDDLLLPGNRDQAAGRTEEPKFAAALSDSTTAMLRDARFTASSSLDPQRALRLARLICACTPHSSYCFILPTGSMRPLFGDRVILLLETVPFDALHVGDIITYHHPRLDTLVVHRLVERDRGGFRSQGDANRRPDDVYVTRANYRQRVFGIIYMNSAL